MVGQNFRAQDQIKELKIRLSSLRSDLGTLNNILGELNQAWSLDMFKNPKISQIPTLNG